MTNKSAEDVLLKNGSIHPPKVRGAIEAWIDHKQERNWKEEQGTIPVTVDRGLENAAYGDFSNFINHKVEENIIEDWDADGKRGDMREVFTSYWDGNEELRNRFKEISYWCHDASILINVKAAEEQGGIERLLDEYGKQTIADAAYDGRQYLEHQDQESDGEDESDDGQASFGKSKFPELHEVGVINDDAGTEMSKLRGLIIAFTKDVEEIFGEDREFDIKWAQRAFLYWGNERFGDEWIEFVVRNHMHTDNIYDAVKWVYNNHDASNQRMHKKYRGNYSLEAGNPDADDVLKAFLDAEEPGWNEEPEEDDGRETKDKWEQYEERAEELNHDKEGQEVREGDSNSDGSDNDGVATDNEASDGHDDVSKWEKFEKKAEELDIDDKTTDDDNGQSEDNSRDTDSSDGSGSSSSGPTDLEDWGREVGTTDKVDRDTRTRTKQQSKVTETTQQSQSKDVQQRKTTTVEEDVECEDFGRPHEIQWPDVEPIDEFERNRIYEGNTFEWALKLPENSVDTMVTSPPYYALRDYDIDDAFPISGDFTCDHNWEDEFCTECGAFLGQLGHEPDPATFVEHIVDLMDRYKRVLKPSGSLWLNIGDTYAGKNIDGRVKAKNKSRMMIPERVYRRMVQTGWRLRDYVIWVKKVWLPDDDLKGNGKPFASSSRLADQWEPMVRFTPASNDYTDVDSNRLKPPSFDGDLGSEGIEGKFREGEDTQRGKTYNELGTNPPDVWLINSDGYDGDHRAVFPEELPARCINITTPDRVCKQCGKPYDKEVHVEDGTILSPGGDYATYEPRCNCDADHQPGVGFDPFLGSGTTAVAAANNGYEWAGVELSEKYQELARERIPTGRQVGLDQW